MQYALVLGVKIEARKGFQGYCECCGNRVIPKCGSLKVHHWAHQNQKDCDSWSEPETEWHREWKNNFPEDSREVIFKSAVNGEIHRADIHTKNGITIEFQNSPISIEELKSREEFYPKLIWVLNGSKFRNHFSFTHNIPDPNNPLLDTFDMIGKVFFKKEGMATPFEEDLVFSTNSPELKGLEILDNYFAFEWKHSHRVWFETNAPVFIDFGHNFLYRLRKREQQSRGPFWYIRVIRKLEFINKYAVY